MMKKSYEKIIWVAIILLFLGAVIRIVIWNGGNEYGNILDYNCVSNCLFRV